MKNSYRVVLIGLAVLGIVYASTGPEKKTKEVKYEPIDICKFPVSMEVGHFVQLEKCGDYKIKLEQVPCGDIGRNSTTDFPCYEGCVTIKVRANYPAILSASLNKSGGDEDMLKEMNLYWENGVNTIQGGTGWEELKLYLEAWDVEIWKFTAGTVKVGEITIKVKPKDTQLED
jgi:hypothetical protein